MSEMLHMLTEGFWGNSGGFTVDSEGPIGGADQAELREREGQRERERE